MTPNRALCSPCRRRCMSSPQGWKTRSGRSSSRPRSTPGRAAAVRLGHPAEANHRVQTSIPMDFTSLDSVLAPADTDDLLRATNLRLVATSLTALPSELPSPVTRQVMAALAVERDKILDHARVLDGADDLLSPPVGPDVSVSPAVREAVSERLPGGITLAGPDSTD